MTNVDLIQSDTPNVYGGGYAIVGDHIQVWASSLTKGASAAWLVDIQAGKTYTFSLDDLYADDGSNNRVDMYYRVYIRNVNTSEQWNIITPIKISARAPKTWVSPVTLSGAEVRLSVGVTAEADGTVGDLYPGDFYYKNVAFSTDITNQAPSVNVGADRTVRLPNTLSLSPTVTDDGYPNNTLTYQWTKVSGKGTVSFSAPTAKNTTATFSSPDNYVLRLTVSDGEKTTSDDVTVAVVPAGSSGPNLIVQSTSAGLSVNYSSTGVGNWQGAIMAADNSLTYYSGPFAVTNWDSNGNSIQPDFRLHYDSSSNKAAAVYQTQTAVTAGTVYTVNTTVTGRVGGAVPKIQIRWLNSSKAALSITSNIALGGTVTAPTGAAFANFVVVVDNTQARTAGYVDFTNVYMGTYVPNTTYTPPPPSNVPAPVTNQDVVLEIQDKSVSGNLITNPSGESGGAGWVANIANSVITGTGTYGWTFLHMESGASQTTYYTSEPFPINPALTYLGLRFVWGGYSGDARVGVQVEWLDVNKTVIGATGEDIAIPVSGAEYNKVVGGYTANTQYGRLRFNQYRYNGSANGNPMAYDYFELREVTAKQSALLSDIENLQSYDAQSVTWVDVIQPTHEISIDRDSVDVGLLNATILDESYDPATGGLILPGAAVRVGVKANNAITHIFTGTINNVATVYPASGARITFTASDAMSLLSNQKETVGVAKINDIPYIIQGKGVAWSVNGNANGVPNATQVSSNDSATVFDQIVITRDSDKGYAWVDANNVLQVWNRANMPTAPVVEFSDTPNTDASYDSYSSIDLGFDTRRTINMVEITYLRYYQNDSAEWVTDEIKYGPYIDANSVKAWGAYKATFTIEGITETEANMAAFANEVLAKNATPTIKANGITAPIRDERARAHAAAIDLYTMVGIKYADRFDGALRVVGINHEISPGKWIADYTFEHADSVAVPIITPSVSGA